MGIFDTGLADAYVRAPFRHAKVKDRTNWTWRRNDAASQYVRVYLCPLLLLHRLSGENSSPDGVNGREAVI